MLLMISGLAPNQKAAQRHPGSRLTTLMIKMLVTNLKKTMTTEEMMMMMIADLEVAAKTEFVTSFQVIVSVEFNKLMYFKYIMPHSF